VTQATLENLIRETPALWRGSESYSRGPHGYSHGQRPGENTVDTGYAALNQLLPNGGWPLRAVVELNVEAWGNGELQLLLPLIKRLTADQTRVAMVAPPYQPYAPALVQAGVSLPYLVVVDTREDTRNKKNRSNKNTWWCAEKLLAHDQCGLVLVWPRPTHPVQVRRLQLAADASNSLGVILHCGRPLDTPVGLRLKVGRSTEGISVTLTKSRYGWRQQGSIVLPQIL